MQWAWLSPNLAWIPEMLKQLITVVCVVAIVIFGACGTGVNLPNPRLPLPPPPIVPGLSQLHTIGIQVQDASGGDPVDDDALTQTVVAKWNAVLKKNYVHFYVMQPSMDATLKIVLLRKTLSCEPSSSFKRKCAIQLITSSTLTGRDGKLIWRGAEEESRGEFSVGYITPQEIWKSDVFMGDAAYCLSFTTLPGSLY
jgi:hypothetical protein